MTRDEFRDAVVHAMRHLQHPYVNGRACLDEIMAAADQYADTKPAEDSKNPRE